MKIKTLLSCFLLVTTGACSLAQGSEFERDFDPIRKELTDWDPVRGEWLANSLLAMSSNKVVPDRMFPESLTPYEMMTMVPLERKEKIKTIASGRRNATSSTGAGTGRSEEWEFIHEFFARINCPTSNGRTYGDPHFSSFDGNSFSLQSVGEFTLAKSKTGYVNVQARQSASGDDFSLNTAIAMNVGGDRLCFYANEKPDSDISTPIRLEGNPIRVTTATYFLPHGGTIRTKGNEYIVTWPTGEKVSIDLRDRGQRFSTMNISTLIFPCVMGGYEGLLGNANGMRNDDLSARGSAPSGDLYASASRFGTVFGEGTFSEANNRDEKTYLDRLTREFGNSWRINDLTSLFDYGIGQSTASFTDYNFPHIHRTIGDLNQNQRERARRRCEEMGIPAEDMRGCIFDNAYLEIPPAPRPVFDDHTSGVVLTKIPQTEARPNINKPAPGTTSNPTTSPLPNTSGKEAQTKENTTSPKPTPATMEQQNSGSESKTPASKPATSVPQETSKPSKGTSVFGNGNGTSSSSPVSTPKPTTSPAPVITPKPPVSSPAPASKGSGSSSPAPVASPVKTKKGG